MSAREWAMRVSFETCSHDIKCHGFDWAVRNEPVRHCLQIMARIRQRSERHG